jgi:hypothetical protein
MLTDKPPCGGPRSGGGGQHGRLVSITERDRIGSSAHVPRKRCATASGRTRITQIDFRSQSSFSRAPRCCDAARPKPKSWSRRVRKYSTRRGSLRGDVDRVERLARRHEQAVALGAAEAKIGADLGQPNTADELARRRPYRHAAIAHSATGIA